MQVTNGDAHPLNRSNPVLGVDLCAHRLSCLELFHHLERSLDKLVRDYLSVRISANAPLKLGYQLLKGGASARLLRVARAQPLPQLTS